MHSQPFACNFQTYGCSCAAQWIEAPATWEQGGDSSHKCAPVSGKLRELLRVTSLGGP